MLPEREIKEYLSGTTGIAIKRPYYRFIGIEYLNDPLSAVYSKANGGRYNFRNAFGVLYLAPDPYTAMKEVSKDVDFRFPPKALITIDVDIQSVFSLKDDDILNALQIERHILLSPWRKAQDIEGREADTQFLGRMIYEVRKFEGIHYPSVVDNSKYNLAVFPDRLKEGSAINIYDPQKILRQSIKK